MNNEGKEVSICSQIIDFINKNFLVGDASVQAINIRKLLFYLLTDDVEILLSMDDINRLLNECPKLTKAVDLILHSEKYHQFLDDVNLATIFTTYAKRKGITLKEKKEDKKHEFYHTEKEALSLYYSYLDEFTNLLTSREEILLSNNYMVN